MTKNRKLKLGWLFPYSGIFTDLRSDLQQGLELALGEDKTAFIEHYPQFIQTGGLKDVEDALKKLLLYDQVDLVIGVTSTKVALSILPLPENRHTPVILLNLGADMPCLQLSSDYLFYNSLHLWKSEWVMGRWAQQKYGGEPSINMSVYEGGYRLHEAFKSGTAVSGAATVKLNIVSNFSSVPDTASLIQCIIDQQPQHAHALLSGKEGAQFLQLFSMSPQVSKTALTVNPFIAEDGLLQELPLNLDLYNATTWSVGLDNDHNRTFVASYKAGYNETPTAFSLLAYEAGLALNAALQEMPGKISRQELAAVLKQTSIMGPRGKIALSTRPLHSNMPVYIRKPVLSPLTGRPINEILAKEQGIEWDAPSLSTEQSFFTGWQNPYLCV